MQKKCRKLISVLVAFVMVFCLFSAMPIAAKAAGDVCEIVNVDGVTVIAQYADLTSALTAVQDNQTIRLLQDINYGQGIVIAGKSVTFDLYGFDLSVEVTSGNALEVGLGGEVLLDDSGGGEFNVKSKIDITGIGLYAHSGGKAAISNAEGADIGVLAIDTGTNVTVYGDVENCLTGAYAKDLAVVLIDGNTVGNQVGVRATTGAAVCVSGNAEGELYCVYAESSATITVGGNAQGNNSAIGVFAVGNTTVKIEGDVTACAGGITANTGATVIISGSVESKIHGVSVDGGAVVRVGGAVTVPPGDTYVLIGGISKTQAQHEPASYKPCHFEYTDNVSYVWVFDPATSLGSGEIIVNGASYTDLCDALDAIDDLLFGGSDVTVTGSWSGFAGDYVLFYIPVGRTLTWRAGFSGNANSSGLIFLYGEGKFVVGNGGSITNTGDSSCTIFTVGVDVAVNSGGAVTNTGDAVDYFTAAISGNNNANVTLGGGGTISATGAKSTDYLCYALIIQPGTFTNNGGTVIGGVYVTGTGNLIVNDTKYTELGEAEKKIQALLYGGSNVTVNGSWSGVIGASLDIYIPKGRSLTWSAAYSGNTDYHFLIYLEGEGSFIVGNGGSITNSGNNSGTIYTYGVNITVNSGGAIKNTGNATDEDTAAIVGHGANVTLNGGTISATGTAASGLHCYALFLNNGKYYHNSGTIIGETNPKAEQSNNSDKFVSNGKDSGPDNSNDEVVEQDKQQDSSDNINTKDSAPFEDVSPDAWYYGDAMYVYDKGLMNGTAVGKFSPNMTLNRAMIVTILYRHAGSPSVDGLENPFDDVADDQWYTNAIKWAAENGIVTGLGNSKFAPNAAITRQDLAIILIRYMNFMEINLPVTQQFIFFADEDDISGYAKDAVQTLFKLSIITGVSVNDNSQTVIAPKSNATRAQVSAILHRFMEAVEK